MEKRKYKGLILNIILVVLVFNVGVLGYRLTKKPDDLVEITVDKKTISHNEDLYIIIHNYGFKGVIYGGGAPIYRIYNNDTVKQVKYPDNVASAAINYGALPLIGKKRAYVYTDHLEPGDYLIKRDYKIQGYGEYYKFTCFTVR